MQRWPRVPMLYGLLVTLPLSHEHPGDTLQLRRQPVTRTICLRRGADVKLLRVDSRGTIRLSSGQAMLHAYAAYF